jgi:hypothetical protein
MFAVLTIIGIVLAVIGDKKIYCDFLTGFGALMSIVCGVALVVCLIALPIARYSDHVTIVGIETQRTMIMQRSQYSEIERAALFNKMLELNKWIAEEKTQKQSIWVGVFIPDEINNVDYLK